MRDIKATSASETTTVVIDARYTAAERMLACMRVRTLDKLRRRSASAAAHLILSLHSPPSDNTPDEKLYRL